jgi:ribonuclease D
MMVTDHKQDEWLDKAEGLASFTSGLKNQPWVAVDTEFMRTNTFSAQLCVLQLATPDRIACIDTCRIDALHALTEVLQAPGTIKVMHAAFQDLEILYQRIGVLPTPIFDTQVAAAMLGYEAQISYAALVEAVTGVKLEKAHTRADWSQRPLDPEIIRYAADDVRYLRDVYLRLAEDLEKRGRLQWLEEEAQRMGDPRTFDPPANEAWRRIKGTDRLHPRERAALRALAGWREERAKGTDRPRRWIVADEALLDMARMLPQNWKELETTRELEPRTLKRHGEEFLKLIASAVNEPESAAPQLEAHQRMTQGQKKFVNRLAELVQEQAKQHGVHESLLAGKKDLARLVLGERDVPQLQGWRREVVGERLLSMVESGAPE